MNVTKHWSTTQSKWVLISDMATPYLRNVYLSKLKMYKVATTDGRAIIEIAQNDPVFSAIFFEYLSRIL